MLSEREGKALKLIFHTSSPMPGFENAFAIESNLLNGGYKEKAFDHEDIHREDNGASSPFALLSDNLACP